MKKPKSTHVSLRMSPENVDAMSELSNRTGWTSGKVIQWLMKIGTKALKEPASDARRELAAATMVHTAEVNAKQTVAAARAKMRKLMAPGKDGAK